MILALIVFELLLDAVNIGTLPLPLADNPIEGLSFIQVKVPPLGILMKGKEGEFSPLQTA